ncbi:MAG: hypothetical protein J6T80_02190 [Paludibacteraceae bacterium]|nr:hypothetical protein [Paludibacteraceae bacterium]
MAIKKTILLVEVTDRDYNFQYSGGFKPDWSHFSDRQRKEILKHDGRLCNAFISCPDAFARIAGLVHCVERYFRREARKKAKGNVQNS